jgi:hypothetical protein
MESMMRQAGTRQSAFDAVPSLSRFSIFSSAVFRVGILANSFSVFAVPLCRS